VNSLGKDNYRKRLRMMNYCSGSYRAGGIYRGNEFSNCRKPKIPAVILRGSVVHRYALWCTGCNGRHGKLLNRKADKLPFCTFNPMVEGSNPSRPTI